MTETAPTGTPARLPRFPNGTVLTVGSFDDPSVFYPTENYGTESKHAAWEDTSPLPGHKATETQSVIRRWQDAGLEVPE